MLTIRQVSSLPLPFDMLDFIPLTETLVCMQTDEGEQRLYRSTVQQREDGWNRRVSSYLVRGDDALALDETHFVINETHFIESEQYRSRGGSNRLMQPISIPRLLDAKPVIPIANAPFTVRCAFHGVVELVSDGWSHQCKAMALHGTAPEQGFVQWLAEGIGEIALGPSDRGFDRWLCGWRSGDQHIGDVPSPTLPALRERESIQPERTIF